MSSQHRMSPGGNTRPQTPQMAPEMELDEHGVSIRPMRLKVLYTFDDQNKTNCLARWPEVLQLKTVALDPTATIGVIELQTCIKAITNCSPELLSRLGQDYTVYAYDYSEYDCPLVGQGMLSKVLQATSPTPNAPAHESQQLITGRVCKNIMGLFSGGIKETLEVKLRLVPVPTAQQTEYNNTMEKYREMSKPSTPNFDPNEWNAFLQQSNNDIAQMASQPLSNSLDSQRDGMIMEAVSQLLNPVTQQPILDPFDQGNNTDQSGNETQASVTAGGKSKNGSRPNSRASVKRPRVRKTKANSTAGGNTSGYEEGTDGDDGPAPKKRAKVQKTAWSNNSAFSNAPDSLRVAAGTSGSIRMFRPIAMNPQAPASHLQDIPRAPTPVPQHLNQNGSQNRVLPQTSLRRESSASQVDIPPQTQISSYTQLGSFDDIANGLRRTHNSPYPQLQPPEDQVRYSIESAGPSPERNLSPVESLPNIGSSPPVMRTRPATEMRSSPPCPSSPILPQMPRTDSGFMSGSLEELFGENDETVAEANEEEVKLPTKARSRPRKPAAPLVQIHHGFEIRQENPGPMENLPSKTDMRPLPRHTNDARALSVMSEDGIVLPPLKQTKRALSRHASMSKPAKVASIPPPEITQARESQQRYGQPAEQQFPPNTLPAEIFQSQQQDNQQAEQQRPMSRNTQAEASHLPQAISQQTELERPRSRNSPAMISLSQRGDSQPADPRPRSSNSPVEATQPPSAPRPRKGSGLLARTASMGSLTLPQIPASDPVLPPSTLYRSQTWSEAPHPATEALYPPTEGGVPSAQEIQQIFQYPSTNPSEVPYNRTFTSKKALIEQKLEQAIANGEMPPFCHNCGAIKTPTWRKAWYKELLGEPGYHDYSDEPGRVTAIIILNKDASGKPINYKLIKKFLLPEEHEEKEYKEFILCNPCGIWMSKYKTQRPENRWEGSGWVERNGGGVRKRVHKPAKPKNKQGSNIPVLTSEANFPPSDANFPQSEANFPQSEGYNLQSEAIAAPEGVSPSETGNQLQTALTSFLQPPEQQNKSRQANKRPLNAMTSDAASAALRRAIQSSPARWAGTRQSPIELEEEDHLGSTRRLLFPSPRKDGSPMVLGDITTNVLQILPDIHSPKEVMMEAPNKENCPPPMDANDDNVELVKLFEEEMVKGAIERPTTPVQRTPPSNPFKTPTRPTPSHRPITRSVTRSGKSVRSVDKLLLFAPTPNRTPRRSPRHHEVFESPFTATMNQLMSEANNHTSPTRSGIELDYGALPDLPDGDGHMNFSLEDFFSTDVPMPSSPPRAFNLYEDPLTGMASINWDDFEQFNGANNNETGNDDVKVKEEPDMSPKKMSNEQTERKKSS